ncbi:type I CRISPR-associated protein Cas7 [Candidatus Micrarchaeota archaeon]|nr:type I CRISPR-associated protein Cas7 [Candidatus Micrarchaeota archaeon]MBU1166567.1 type I CRISPR-associated protein Cas7 [Candidatus Micrarchaeota archaeon]
MSDETKLYENFACGVFIVRADNANFNADFSGMPRELPDGRIYATDKALKYCIRKYVHDVLGEDSIFAWRRFEMSKKGGKLEPRTLDTNIEYLYEKKNSTEKAVKNIEQKEMVELALSKLDVRLFGATLAVGDKNISLSGPCQITYGVNIFETGSAYTSPILSPYSSGEGKEKSTIGAESRATELHYVYDFNINPFNLTKDEQLKILLGEKMKEYCLKSDDITKLKETITRGVNYVTSTTKAGAVSELLLFVEFNGEQDNIVPLVPLLKSKIKITTNGNKRKIHLSEAVNSLSVYGKANLEVYYDPEYTELEYPQEVKPKLKHILTHKDL